MNVLKLAKNVSKTNIITDLDIVLEGGCMNGAYEIGGLLLIKELEKKNNIRVERISGTSIGALVAFLYLTDNLNYYVDSYHKMRVSFHTSLNLNCLKAFFNDMVPKISAKKIKHMQSNVLYIRYYDVDKGCFILKDKYCNVDEMVSTILKSCHIPYLINGEPFFIDNKGVYLDGGMPYIFKPNIQKTSTKRVLYMRLTQITKMGGMFNVRNEEIIEGRVLEGLLDTYNFLLKGHTTSMCSYVEDWNILTTMRYNLFSFIYRILIHVFINSREFLLLISPNIKKHTPYNHFKPALDKLYDSIIRYMVFN
tara:strand:- start:307 stop:1230 length:924 start_codon:yes stop_codon:yes gene_type:complete